MSEQPQSNEDDGRRLGRMFDRLKSDTGMGKAEFSRAFQVPGGPSMISQHISGNRPISLEAVTAYAAGFKCAVGDISPRLAKEIAALTQVGQVDSMGPVTKFGTPTATQTDPPLVIPQYAAGGAMGNGGLVLEERQPGLIKSWHVDHEWLRLNVRHYTGIGNLCIVTGFGPSMQPKYNPGDPLLLDRGVTAVESDGVYFFRVGKHGFIKQLQRIPTERGLVIRAKSANKDYDPFDISDGMDFEVFGKVLTVWKSEQV